MDHEDQDLDFFGGFLKPSPIPDFLHSVYNEGPFRTCTVCGGDLADGRLYEIQKVFRGKEAIFEMAVCQKCGEDVSMEFSEQSVEKIKKFLVENFRPTDDALHCHFCGFPRGVIHSFTAVGFCRERSVILPSVIMCEKCNEKIQEELSRKTRDVQGDFIRDHFPGVPADLDLSPNFSGLLT